MSRFTALLLAVRLFLSHAVLPSLVFTAVVYAATVIGGGGDLVFSLYSGLLVMLPFTLLAAEEWSIRLKAAARPAVPVVETVPPLPVIKEVETGVRIAAEIRADELASHRSSVHRDGGTIVSSSFIGGPNERYMVVSHYPANAFN